MEEKMAIILNTIDSKKITINIICSALNKCISLRPDKEKKVNISPDLYKPEYILVKKDANKNCFTCRWYAEGKYHTFNNISMDIEKMEKDVEGMVTYMDTIGRPDPELEYFEQECYEFYRYHKKHQSIPS